MRMFGYALTVLLVLGLTYLGMTAMLEPVAGALNSTAELIVDAGEGRL